MHPGRKILNLRHDRKLSQQDLARACQITPSALSKIESGINAPRAHVMWSIANQLDVSIEYLLDETLPYPPAGLEYRESVRASDKDPASRVKMEVTREEKAFLEALRDTNPIAREIAFCIPETPVDVLRMIHFLVHNARYQSASGADLMDRVRSILGSRVPAKPSRRKKRGSSDEARKKRGGSKGDDRRAANH